MITKNAILEVAMQLNEAMFTDVCGRMFRESTFTEAGTEYINVPTSPIPLLFWAATRCARPLFDAAGKLKDWETADADTRTRYRIIVEETARSHGYTFEGCGPVFDNDVACRLAVVMIANNALCVKAHGKSE